MQDMCSQVYWKIHSRSEELRWAGVHEKLSIVNFNVRLWIGLIDKLMPGKEAREGNKIQASSACGQTC